MKTQIKISAALLASVALLPATLQAKVTKQDANGFLVSHISEVKASPDEIWDRLIKPKDWWNKSHSWSGSVEGFYIEPKAGGCFCENIFEKGETANARLIGSVEHMRVIQVNSGKVLRMTGALGPLQSEAVTGVMTVAIQPHKEKEGVSQVSFNYIVGGYMRFKVAEMAPAVDGVIGEQFKGLLKPFEDANGAEKSADAFKLDLDELKPALDDKAEKTDDEAQGEAGR